MAFLPPRLLSFLAHLSSTRRFVIAYSGGLDSRVLLEAMANLRGEYGAELSAVHINHGLQSAASDWADHCRETCERLEVPYQQVDLKLEIEKGESTEAVAREARYGVFREMLSEGDALMTAHHQDDQAETLLLQLMRGSGPSGLAAMPRVAPFGPARLARPLLDFSREQLHQYAMEAGLEWVEDASNRDLSFDRNFLRQQVLPLLTSRWPAAARTLSRSARHCAEAQSLIDEMAAADLATMGWNGQDFSLPIAALVELPKPRTRAVLRAWIRSLGFQLPDAARLDRVLREMLTAAEDRMPMVHWQGTELRRYQGRLYLMSPLQRHDVSVQLEWDGDSTLKLPTGLGHIEVEKGEGGIDPEKWASGKIRVCFRQGGERCQPLGRRHRHQLKKLLQEVGIPPWQRDRIPLIMIDDQLAAVGDLWVCEPFGNNRPQPGVLLQWFRA